MNFFEYVSKIDGVDVKFLKINAAKVHPKDKLAYVVSANFEGEKYKAITYLLPSITEITLKDLKGKLFPFIIGVEEFKINDVALNAVIGVPQDQFATPKLYEDFEEGDQLFFDIGDLDKDGAILEAVKLTQTLEIKVAAIDKFHHNKRDLITLSFYNDETEIVADFLGDQDEWFKMPSFVTLIQPTLNKVLTNIKNRTDYIWDKLAEDLEINAQFSEDNTYLQKEYLDVLDAKFQDWFKKNKQDLVQSELIHFDFAEEDLEEAGIKTIRRTEKTKLLRQLKRAEKSENFELAKKLAEQIKKIKK